MINRYKYFLGFIIIVMKFIAPVDVIAMTEIEDKVTLAFARAFSKPEHFKETRIFHLLNYSEKEISLIGKITPQPASISVSIKNFTSDGSFGTIRVQCQQVKYYHMVIDNAVFEFPNITLDMEALNKGKIIFTKASYINLETNVSEADLLKVFDLIAKAKSLTGLKLKLDRNQIKMRGRTKKGWLVVQFRLAGSISLVDSSKINFRCNKLTLNRFPLPRTAINSIFRRINPVFNSEKTWLHLLVDKVNIDKGFVRTHARIMPSKGKQKGLDNAN